MSDPPLRQTSPCEHGVEHEFLELQEGLEFWTEKCKQPGPRGKMNYHRVTPEVYPQTVRRPRG